MRLLILGGTQFLGRTIADDAVALGHAVTCAARGLSGPPPDGVRFVAVDRDRPHGLAPLVGERFDAAVDVSRHPGQVRRAVEALRGRVGHWTFVSTTSVYADTARRGQRAADAPVLPPTGPEVERGDGDHYGAAKVACERVFGAGALICRAGLIVGPGDPTGRFGYWIARLRRGGEVLVPAAAEDPVQVIDVRDLARWIVQAAGAGLAGTFDAIGPSRSRQTFLDECVAVLGASCAFTWVDQAFLDRHGIGSGSGPRSLPLPMPDSIGDNARDISAAIGAGLTPRALGRTARDTADWLDRAGGAVTGLTAGEERDALDAWHAERG